LVANQIKDGPPKLNRENQIYLVSPHRNRNRNLRFPFPLP
jgi:hypothetical protein